MYITPPRMSKVRCATEILIISLGSDRIGSDQMPDEKFVKFQPPHTLSI